MQIELEMPKLWGIPEKRKNKEEMLFRNMAEALQVIVQKIPIFKVEKHTESQAR